MDFMDFRATRQGNRWVIRLKVVDSGDQRQTLHDFRSVGREIVFPDILATLPETEQEELITRWVMDLFPRLMSSRALPPTLDR